MVVTQLKIKPTVLPGFTPQRRPPPIAFGASGWRVISQHFFQLSQASKQSPLGLYEHIVIIALVVRVRVTERDSCGVVVDPARARKGIVAQLELVGAPACGYTLALAVAPGALPVRFGGETGGDVIKDGLGDAVWGVREMGIEIIGGREGGEVNE